VSRTIAGKVIIVTGASSGIGRAAALMLGRENARLALVARREDRLRQLAGEIGSDPLVLPLDLRGRSGVEEMIRTTQVRFGRIDILINNAGFGFLGSVERTPPAVVREIFDLNFEAPLLASQLVIPIMRAQGAGHIINVSSIVGKRGLPGNGIYCATKFALNGISESLRVELRKSNIDVSIISPASTTTEFGEHVRHGDGTPGFKYTGPVQSAEEVAATIVRCIRNPKIEVFPSRFTRLLAWANALAPSLVDKVIARVFSERIEALSSTKK
jgi:short-subunit dehydrogenase